MTVPVVLPTVPAVTLKLPSGYHTGVSEGSKGSTAKSGKCFLFKVSDCTMVVPTPAARRTAVMRNLSTSGTTEMSGGLTTVVTSPPTLTHVTCKALVTVCHCG